MKKFLLKLLLIPLTLLVGLACAWVPMLGWNIGVHAAFPNVPTIGYWEAYWLFVALCYLKTTVVSIKE